MLLTKSDNQKFGSRKRTIDRDIRIGPLSIQFIIVVILASLALLYLAQTTEGATKNYKIRELDEKKKQLEQDNERLEIESVRLKSLNGMKEKINEMGMENADKVNYLPGEQPIVRR